MRIRNAFIVFGFLLAGILSMALFCYADDYWVNQASNTSGTHTKQYLIQSYPGDMLGSLLINQRSPVPETFTIYDSSQVAFSTVAIIDLYTGNASSSVITSNQYIFNLRMSSGITYSKSAGNANITILWKKNYHQ